MAKAKLLDGFRFPELRIQHGHFMLDQCRSGFDRGNIAGYIVPIRLRHRCGASCQSTVWQ